jgi:hypothetical protein
VLIGASEDAPIDVLRVIAEAVLLVGGELGARPLEWAFVGTGEVSLDRVSGKKREPTELKHLGGVQQGGDALFGGFFFVCALGHGFTAWV